MDDAFLDEHRTVFRLAKSPGQAGMEEALSSCNTLLRTCGDEGWDAFSVLDKRVSLSSNCVIISYYTERNAFGSVSTLFRSRCMRVSLNVQIAIIP